MVSLWARRVEPQARSGMESLRPRHDGPCADVQGWLPWATNSSSSGKRPGGGFFLLCAERRHGLKLTWVRRRSRKPSPPTWEEPPGRRGRTPKKGGTAKRGPSEGLGHGLGGMCALDLFENLPHLITAADITAKLPRPWRSGARPVPTLGA